ncbi:MAG: polysaccharide deacetylase family protein [Candidatus Hydrogenedentes bacterium]|nr:polysaccharide deacetylase family protein [Candidatus Hydrogenedentota bacterium]
MVKGQRLKNRIKQLTKSTIGALGPIFLRETSRTRILTYHSIGYRRYEMNVTPEAFAVQMAWLAANQNVISLESAATGEEGVALTFDDGYRDNLINALPILEHYGFPATVFVVSGCLGATLPREKEPDSGRLLSAEELREAASRGLMIGGHTRSHPRLASLTPERQMEEIAGCKADLEAILEFSIRTFAYPYGSALDYDAESVAAVKRAGFELAFSNRYGPVHADDGPFAFRRIWIDSTDTLTSFEDKVSGRLDGLRLQDSALGIRARRLLNAWMGTR